VKQTRYAEAAGRLLRRLRAEGPPALPRDRDALVAAVEQALRRRARRGALVRGGLAVGAAAAAVVVAVSFVGGLRAPVAVSEAPRPGAAPLTVLSAVAGAASTGDDRPLPLHQGMVITAGLHLTAPAIAEVQVGTTAGTALTLERRGELTVNEAGATQRFALTAGGLRAHVSRLVAGQRFVVDTLDAEVEVHGTTFRVAIVAPDPACGGGTRTRVSVTEGIVTVRSPLGEVHLGAGAEWPAGCAVVEAEPRRAARPVRRVEAVASGVDSAASATRTLAKVTPLGPPPVVLVPRPEALARPTSGSLLAEQNDLFATAIRAKQAGRAPEAVEAFASLIRSFPEGPLVESAMAQRMKTLASFDRAGAARAAVEYIDRFPTGFARADAERLIVRSSP
jgi:hypothetical protein